MKKISKKISFQKLLENHPETAEALLKEGMHCVGCPMAMQETLEEGAMAHGIDPDKLVEKLNKIIKK